MGEVSEENQTNKRINDMLYLKIQFLFKLTHFILNIKNRGFPHLRLRVQWTILMSDINWIADVYEDEFLLKAGNQKKRNSFFCSQSLGN